MFKHLFFLLLIFFGHFTLKAQEINGRILDANNKHVAFATIQNNATSGVISNEEGYFSITLNEGDKTLTISCLGFKTKDVTIDELKRSKFLIVLDEQVNQLDTVYVSTSIPDANEIIRQANANLNKNYKNEQVSYRLFYRGTEYNKFESLAFEIDKASGFKKRELTDVNLSLDSLTRVIKNSQSIDFTDYLGDLMIYTKENAKLNVVKATKLIDTKNSVSVDKVQDKAQKIFLTYLDTTKTYKLKTGLLKIEDSLSLSNTNEKESSSAFEYETNTLKDLSHEHIHKSQIYDNTLLTELINSDLYDYTYLNATVYDGELVHIISYEPRRSKAKFEGVLYITDENYAIIKADYQYAKGKRGQKLNLKLLLGIKFIENFKKGTIIFSKSESQYHPKYIKEESGAYFYVNRPLKFIENSKERRKVGFSFLIEGNNKTKKELLVISHQDLNKEEFDLFTEQEQTPYQKLSAYDPGIWSKYTSLEPLQ